MTKISGQIRFRLGAANELCTLLGRGGSQRFLMVPKKCIRFGRLQIMSKLDWERAMCCWGGPWWCDFFCNPIFTTNGMHEKLSISAMQNFLFVLCLNLAWYWALMTNQEMLQFLIVILSVIVDGSISIFSRPWMSYQQVKLSKTINILKHFLFPEKYSTL